MTALPTLKSVFNDVQLDDLMTLINNRIMLNTPFVTPENFGAKGDGTTDDSAAIQLAIDSGNPVLFWAKTYYLGSSLSLTNDRTLIGNGEGSVLYIDSDAPCILIEGANNTVFNLSFLGNGRDTVTPYATNRPNQHGIMIEGNVGLTSEYVNNIITECRFSTLGGAGFYIKNQIGAAHPGNQLVNCISYGNCWGYFCDTRGEYTKFIGCTAYSNQIGYRIIGGNNSIASGSVTNNVTGIKLENGANNAHSVATGVMINHDEDYAVWSAGITLGFVFSNCTMYGSDIYMDACTGTVFDGCLMEVGNIYALNSPVKNTIQNCTFPSTPILSLNANWGNFFNNKYWGSAPAEDINYFAQPALFSGVPVYADNAAAVSGGLVIGQIYRTGDDLKIVHA